MSNPYFFLNLSTHYDDGRDWGVGRAYNVNIVAEDENGKEIRFTEIAEYPEKSKGPSGCVRESEREAKAVIQVRERMPHLRNVRANGSIHV